jgi:hypothetical protein
VSCRMVFYYSWTRGGVGWVYLVFVLNIVPRVFVLTGFFLFVLVFRLFFAAKLVTNRLNLNARRVLVVGVVVRAGIGAGLVIDSAFSRCSLESDCNVSVALDVKALRGRREFNTRRRCAVRLTRRRRSSMRLDRTLRSRPPSADTGHCATIGKMGYD